LHRVARVEQDYELAIGLAAISFHIASLGSREEVPIHVAQIIAWNVSPIFGELLTEAKVGRPMQSGNKAVYYCLSQQVQRRDARKYRRIEEALHHISLGLGI
jgi:hypothetical protein